MADIKALVDGSHALVVAAHAGTPTDADVDGVDTIEAADNQAVIVWDTTGKVINVRDVDGTWLQSAALT